MPYPNAQNNPAAATPVYLTANPNAQVNPVPPTPVPTTIAGGGNWASGIIPGAGYNKLATTAQLSQAGTLTIQRYVNAAGTIPIGAAIVQALSANTLGYAAVNDGLPFASWQVTIANTSGSVGNLTNVVLLETP